MDDEKRAIYENCTRFLTRNPRLRTSERLAELASFADPEARPDSYGKGRLIEDFEAKIAKVLGKPAAVFMPSGTMAQPIALRIWSDRKQNKNVGFHPLSHLEIHEEKGYAALHGLKSVLIGDAKRLITLADLESCPQPLSALLLELPQREIGGVLPSWDELVALCAQARSRGIALHMDGARLWECQPFYRREYSEIAGLFDSVYVSFYKGLGGIAGAVLAGDPDFIAEARVWQRRQGGNLVSLYPYVLSADLAFTTRLGKMGAYYEKARELAGVFSEFDPVAEIKPNPPQTNMMHLHLRGEKEALERACLEIAREHRIKILDGIQETDVSGVQLAEFNVGDATLEFSAGQIRELFVDFFQRAGSRC